MIRVSLPPHLRTLARVADEVELEVAGPVTQRAVLDALESRYPVLRGTIRDRATGQRRAFVRIFACREDLSHQPPDAPLPDDVRAGRESLVILGALAGGQKGGEMTSSDPHGHHDWHSEAYVEGWISRDATRDEQRVPLLRRVVGLIPRDHEAPIRVLDVGAGYGALSQQVLELLPRAELVCQDFSEPMLARARERLAWASERVSFAMSDLQEPGWTRELGGPFDAVVSAIAIHNVRHPARIREIYREVFGVVAPGGCFLNCDLVFGARGGGEGAEPASLDHQLRWLGEAGFERADCPWQELPSAILAAYRAEPR